MTSEILEDGFEIPLDYYGMNVSIGNLKVDGAAVGWMQTAIQRFNY